jgi:VIT1/CCC1 family predicted Fe2+/Mn2+ transporter
MNVFADVPAHASGHLVLPTAQLWTLVIGALVPLVTYIVNRYAPWVSEPVKAVVLAVAAAAASALYTALGTHIIGFNAPTLQLVLTAVVTAFITHAVIWKPSGISVLLGAGTDRQKHPPLG